MAGRRIQGDRGGGPAIQLDQFLKTCGVPTGGQAKQLIQSGQVAVNGELETRRRRKLVEGDIVQWGDERIQVEFEPESSSEVERPASLDCIDIGANLTHSSFQNDLPQVLQAARSAGVLAMIVTGSCPATSRQGVELSRRYPGFLYATAGIHPHEARHCDQETWDQLERLLPLPEVVAVGECGLDFNRDFSPRDRQRECFASQLKLARRTQLPLFLHERDAHEALLELVRPIRDQLGRAAVHCFTGSEKQLRTYLDLDLYIGITGWICDERRGTELRDLVRLIPADRLMIETDAPYLAPRDLRPRVHRNEPKYLPHILCTVAACRGETPQALAPRLVETTRRFFQLG